MAYPNENYKLLKESYLFSDIAKRVTVFAAANPDKKVIRMGIGDVTLPLAPVVVNAMKAACDEMGKAESFRGYGPEQGYEFLRKAISGYYKTLGASLELDEIFVSDGAKSDVANLTDLFSGENTVMIPDPVYPVYEDSNLMLGRKLLYMDGNEENGFLPMPDGRKADIVYLCSPNNPTGAVYNREQLKKWIDYALENSAVLLFDTAYESFVGDKGLPRSIYELEGAKRCAIEICSLSKTAGFTGTRCSYTVVPKELICGGMSLNKMWLRRQSTKFNGTPYIVQRGAEAVFTAEGLVETRQSILYYMENAKLMAAALSEKGIKFTGGVNSPYIWFKCPNGMKSWDFFDLLLTKAAVVGTPGAGFGKNGEGWFRLTAFNTHENTAEAMLRLKSIL